MDHSPAYCRYALHHRSPMCKTKLRDPPLVLCSCVAFTAVFSVLLKAQLFPPRKGGFTTNTAICASDGRPSMVTNTVVKKIFIFVISQGCPQTQTAPPHPHSATTTERFVLFACGDLRLTTYQVIVAGEHYSTAELQARQGEKNELGIVTHCNR